ncbi:UV DNA damage repair endonuclease UvsE [Paenibacillus xerothermodurans]|uniref:UV DNA damage repair endonuclease UvsE n=1 Tax=Paenibacillus xerothermodurans TaxID=1977292 RepID=A0A2W1N7B9_PAEXE|nr:UV DNA damage repair endonuclease UvsE [Paenibacillus xerothermodurans]PZE19734.1 UV DNA damage repair endonuclease UvsE [Paenibacillus xerothermodurans]
MIVRLGYVAMSMLVANASPSKTMTATNFAKLHDRQAAVRKLERIAAENIHNTLRLLKHNRAYDIHVYRCSSRLIPLLGHEMLADWDPMPVLKDDFAELGRYAREHNMRLSFHPDHFTVLSSPREDVLKHSFEDLDRHVSMLEAMGLGESAKCNIHIGGTYGNKKTAHARFVQRFQELPARIQRRLTLENDDKTFTAAETLEVCEQVGAPMVLDVHHHQVNHEEEHSDPAELWPRIQRTWQGETSQYYEHGLPPKIHVSSPKNEKDVRAHADFIDLPVLMQFLRAIAPHTPRLDIMIEAKKKDQALFKLMEDVHDEAGVNVLNQASFELA